MTKRVYLSNISPVWPFHRQEALLRKAIPGYPDGVMVFRDELDSKARQGRHAAMLARRSIMLRDTHRPTPEDVCVAALAVLDWTIKGLSACMKLLAARQATLHVLDAGLKIPPSNGAELMYHVIE